MSDKFTVRQFNYRFPTEDACLEELKVLRFGERLDCPKCGKNNKFYKVKGRKAYQCNSCRHQIYPLAGTIFEKSTTPLKDWFYAIYLMTQTRAGMSAKQLERMLGVTYKTAWRMFKQIRKLMADDGDMLTGEVEIDETYMHPDPTKNTRLKPKLPGKRFYDSQVVFGMVERGGRARVLHVKSSGKRVLQPEIAKSIDPTANVYSDEHPSYHALTKKGYSHQTVNHSLKIYVSGAKHTQNVENFWSNFKRGMKGVYRHCDARYLQSYVDEYAFRYSHRNNPNMFDKLLGQVTRNPE